MTADASQNLLIRYVLRLRGGVLVLTGVSASGFAGAPDVEMSRVLLWGDAATPPHPTHQYASAH